MDANITAADARLLAALLHWSFLPTPGNDVLIEGCGARLIARRQGCVTRYVVQGYAHDGRDTKLALALIERAHQAAPLGPSHGAGLGAYGVGLIRRHVEEKRAKRTP